MEASREFSRTPPRLPPCSDVSVFQKTRMSHFWDTHHTFLFFPVNQLFKVAGCSLRLRTLQTVVFDSCQATFRVFLLHWGTRYALTAGRTAQYPGLRLKMDIRPHQENVGNCISRDFFLVYTRTQAIFRCIPHNHAQ